MWTLLPYSVSDGNVNIELNFYEPQEPFTNRDKLYIRNLSRAWILLSDLLVLASSQRK